MYGPAVASMFEFNHINPKTKHKSYKAVIARRLSSEVLDEVDKCGLMCSECHKILTLQRITGTVKISYEVGGRAFTKEGAIQGIMKFDPVTGDVNGLEFFGDVRITPEVYEVTIGDGEPRTHSHEEFNESNLLTRFLVATRTQGELTIRLLDGTVMFQARKIEGDSCEIESTARCTLLDHVEMTSDNGKETFHCRNGKMISTTGKVSTRFAYKLTMPYDQEALRPLLEPTIMPVGEPSRAPLETSGESGLMGSKPE